MQASIFSETRPENGQNPPVAGSSATPVQRLYEVAQLQVTYKFNSTQERLRITASRDAYNALRRLWSGHIAWREEFYLLTLNRANEVIGYFRVSEGGVSGTVADAKVIFGVALGCSASAIILAHNHPSGNLLPSQADKDLTRKLKEAGRILDIPVLDHLIITPCDTYLSFADEGIL